MVETRTWTYTLRASYTKPTISLCLLHTIATSISTDTTRKRGRVPVPPDKYLSPGSPSPFHESEQHPFRRLVRAKAPEAALISRRLCPELFHPRHEIYNAVRRAFAFTRPEGKTEKGRRGHRGAQAP